MLKSHLSILHRRRVWAWDAAFSPVLLHWLKLKIVIITRYGFVYSEDVYQVVQIILIDILRRFLINKINLTYGKRSSHQQDGLWTHTGHLFRSRLSPSAEQRWYLIFLFRIEISECWCVFFY